MFIKVRGYYSAFLVNKYTLLHKTSTAGTLQNLYF